MKVHAACDHRPFMQRNYIATANNSRYFARARIRLYRELGYVYLPTKRRGEPDYSST